MLEVNIIGAGLAGSEACYQLLKRGVKVNLFEMKPVSFSPAHKNPNFAELVCSNSLKSDDITKAKGLLKKELLELDSLVIKTAYETRVPAGSSLSVDREEFSQKITEKLKSFENLNIISGEVESFNTQLPTIVATGPLTSDKLAKFITKLIKSEDDLYFFDAIAPIITKDSLIEDCYFVQDRYDKGENGGDYINCPMNKEEYELFYNELINAETVKLKDFENKNVFEGCMPVEVLAKRGIKSLLFGPLKPKGLTDPKTNKRPYAVVQLRKENKTAEMLNLVGFQTNLTFSEQKRVFSLIPALKNAEFIRFGVMHKNIYLNAPKVLNEYYQLKDYPNIFIAGQLSGVEGYVESISSGFYAGINMYNFINHKPFVHFPNYTAIGSLPYFITNYKSKNFQPMNMNFGVIIDNLGGQNCKNKIELVEKSLNEIEKLKGDILWNN